MEGRRGEERGGSESEREKIPHRNHKGESEKEL